MYGESLVMGKNGIQYGWNSVEGVLAVQILWVRVGWGLEFIYVYLHNSIMTGTWLNELAKQIHIKELLIDRSWKEIERFVELQGEFKNYTNSAYM